MTLAAWLQDRAWRQLAKSTRPILIGPWRSEVGFETLYWLPWLTKWRLRYGIDKSRLIAVSRGGAAEWYDAGQTVDLFDYAPVASVRRAMLAGSLQHGTVKQYSQTPQEEALLASIQADLGVADAYVLHPRLMYHALTPWWEGQIGLAQAVQQLAFAPIPTSGPPLHLPLPEKFVAVSFYARATWPLDEELREWAAALVEGLAKIVPVVLLESGLHADDHLPFPVSGPNILSTAPSCTTQNNLAVQASVLAKAHAFVGTYGGTMQLAVRLKKPSMGFFSHFAGTAYAHKALTEWLATEQQTPCFIGRPEDAKFVQEALQIAYVPPPARRGSSQVPVPA